MFSRELIISASFYVNKEKRKKYYFFGKLGYSGQIVITYENLNNIKESFSVFATNTADMLNEMRNKVDSICKYRKFSPDVADLIKGCIPETIDRD